MTRLALKYIFFEIIGVFALGTAIFTTVILMFQSFRLAELTLSHEASARTIGEIFLFLALSVLPLVLPVALLFGVLIVYSRMAVDSEITAFRSMGFSPWTLLLPAIALGALSFILSAHTSFSLGPWGTQRMNALIHEMTKKKPNVAIKEGVFSEGFFNLVFYVNKVEPETGRLSGVFIYDERDPQNPLVIVAQEGELLTQTGTTRQQGLLRLSSGAVHRANRNTQTKITFKEYEVGLETEIPFSEAGKANSALDHDELKAAMNDPQRTSADRRNLRIEYQRRWVMAFTGIIFAVLGATLGMKAGGRRARSSGFVLSLAIVTGYWLIYATVENLTRGSSWNETMALWTPNVLFAGLAAWTLRRNLKL